MQMTFKGTTHITYMSNNFAKVNTDYKSCIYSKIIPKCLGGVVVLFYIIWSRII